MTLRRLLVIIIVLAALFIIAVLDSKYNLTVTEYTVWNKLLPPEFDGMRVVHLSDLHGSRFGKNNRLLVDAVLSQKPDLIAITGDMASDISEIPAFEELIEGIEGAAPIYYVNGNHEWAGHCIAEVEEMLTRHGVRCLRNEFELLYKPGTDRRILICGADDPNGAADMLKPNELADIMIDGHTEDYAIWLCHRNDYVTMYPNIPANLLLCGHAHGGVIRLPFYGGLLNLYHRFGAEYEKGLYYGKYFTMVVSRGLGNSIAVPRLFNRPEIVVVTLRHEA